MKTLTEKTMEVCKTMDETMNACMKQMNFTDMMEDMDNESFDVLQKAFSTFRQCKELAILQAKVSDEQSEQLEGMNKKMDLLLKKIERLESKQDSLSFFFAKFTSSIMKGYRSTLVYADTTVRSSGSIPDYSFCFYILRKEKKHEK